MSKRYGKGRVALPLLGAAIALSFATAGLAEAQEKTRCTVNMAMSALASEDKTAICDCEVVTIGFVRYLQGRSDISEILGETAGLCSDLAVVLSETPVAGFFENEYIAQDPRGGAPGSCSESECGGELPATRYVPPPPPPPKEPDCEGADRYNYNIC